jgi:hypothetical protein
MTTEAASKVEAGTATTAASTSTATSAATSAQRTEATGTQQAQQTTQTEKTAATNESTTATALTTAATEAGKTAPATWPDDWREKIAGGDAKVLERLKRFDAPAKMWESYTQLEKKVSSGELKPVKVLAADAKPEEVAAWRKENGIPEKPDGYLEAIGKDVIPEAADKEVIGKFLGKMHEANADPKSVKAAVDWFYKNFEDVQVQQATNDAKLARETEEALRAEWGNVDFIRNRNIILGHLDTAPSGVKDALLNARLADGRALMNDPNILRYFFSSAMEANPAATVVPGAGANAGKSIVERKGEIEKLMGNKGSEYWKGPNADRLQKEYRDLINAELAMKRKSA